MEISLHRVIVFGKEIDKLKQFYVDNFGFYLYEEIKNEWVILQAGQMEIALHRIGREYIDDSKPFKANSNTKLVFRIHEDLPQLRQRLIANGVAMQGIRSFAGTNSMFCDGEDPEGNVFQLEQRAH